MRRICWVGKIQVGRNTVVSHEAFSARKRKRKKKKRSTAGLDEISERAEKSEKQSVYELARAKPSCAMAAGVHVTLAQPPAVPLRDRADQTP